MFNIDWFSNNSKNRLSQSAARQIIHLLIFNTGVTCLVFLFLTISNPLRFSSVVSSLVFIPFWTLFLIPIRRGQYKISTLIAVSLNFGLTLLQVWLDGGIQSPNYYELLIGIIFAALAYGIAGTLITSFFSLAAGLIFSIYQTQPLIYTQQEFMLINLANFMTIVLYFYSSIHLLKKEVKSNQKLAEKLSTSETGLKKLLHNLPLGVMVVNFKGEISLFNERLSRLMGINQHEIKTDQDWYRLTQRDPEVKTNNDRQFGELLRMPEGTVMTGESEGYTRNGEHIEFEAYLTLLGDEIVCMLNDVTERKKAEKEIARKMAQLTSLRTLDIAIMNSEKLSELLEIFLQQISTQLDGDAIWVILSDKLGSTLLDGFSFGFSHAPGIEQLKHQGANHRLLDNFDPQLFETSGAVTDTFGSNFHEYSFCASIPMITKNGVVGILSVFRKSAFSPNPDWLRFFEALAGQTAIGIDRINLNDNLLNLNQSLVVAYDTTLQGWARALELRDKETEGHSRRVADMTIQLARAMTVPEGELQDYYRGALLHDIGKMPVPDSILLKNGPLTEDEWQLMRQHPQTAHHLLKNIPFLERALEIPYSHHENWDGTGYPQGLKGEQIPLSARIFAIADVWDALTSDRPYRQAWTADRVLDYVVEKSGKQFDPAVVTAFKMMMQPNLTGK